MSRQLLQPDAEECRLLQLPASAESFWAVIEFLSQDKAVFDKAQAGRLVPVVRHQVERRFHACAVRGKALVGYCGWVLMTREIGEQWLRGEVESQIPFVPPERADAAALTIVRVLEPKLVLPLIRRARELNPGKRVFFRRDYEGSQKPQKKATVLNVLSLIHI